MRLPEKFLYRNLTHFDTCSTKKDSSQSEAPCIVHASNLHKFQQPRRCTWMPGSCCRRQHRQNQTLRSCPRQHPSAWSCTLWIHCPHTSCLHGPHRLCWQMTRTLTKQSPRPMMSCQPPSPTGPTMHLPTRAS